MFYSIKKLKSRSDVQRSIWRKMESIDTMKSCAGLDHLSRMAMLDYKRMVCNGEEYRVLTSLPYCTPTMTRLEIQCNIRGKHFPSFYPDLERRLEIIRMFELVGDHAQKDRWIFELREDLLAWRMRAAPVTFS